jgi:hypothetical protein
VAYERDGERVCLPTKRETLGTRLKFPQVSADLNVRWCSAYLKIDVMARVLSPDRSGVRLRLRVGLPSTVR